MAIYVDANAYLPNHDVSKIYEYLYYLMYMLAVKKRYFYTQSDYENFSLMGATQIYRRLTNPRQFLEEDDPRKLKKIKSCLNYMKKVLYPFKIDYQREYFNQIISPDQAYLKNTEILEEGLKRTAIQNCSIFLETELDTYISDICKTIKAFVSKLPYRRDTVITKNIYVSCLLSLLNQMTWSNENLSKLGGKIHKPSSVANLIDKIYQKEQESGVILYHLESDMYNYIAVVVNEIKTVIKKEIKILVGSNEPSEEIIKTIISTSIEETTKEVDI